MAYSLQALLDRVQISRRELDAALEAGALTPDMVVSTAGGSRKIADLDEAERQLRAHLEARAAEGRLGTGSVGIGEYDLQHETARRMHWLASREELRYLVDSGELLDRLGVVREITAVIVSLRERMTQIPGQLAAELAVLDEPFAIEGVLREAIEAGLRDVSARVGTVVLLDDEG